MIPSKTEVIQACLELVNSRINQTQSDLKKTQESANNETKSSMGDKYETGRAMAQNEKQKLQVSLSNLLKQKETLAQIKSSKENAIGFGSLVKTNNQIFFISIPLGLIRVKEKELYALSPISPLGKLLSGKKESESVVLNGKTINILEIEN